MIDRFHTRDGFPQSGVMQVDVLDQLGLCIRRPGDEHCARIGNRFGDVMKIVGTRRCVPASDGVCLVMDMSGRMIRMQDERFDVGRIEMKHASFTVIDPDHGVIVVLGH